MIDRNTVKRINKFDYIVQIHKLGNVLCRADAIAYDAPNYRYVVNDYNGMSSYETFATDDELRYIVKMSKLYPDYIQVSDNRVTITGDIRYLIKRIIQDNTNLDMSV